MSGPAKIAQVNPDQHDWDQQSQRCRKCDLSLLEVTDVKWCSVGKAPAVSSLPNPEPLRVQYSREEIVAEARAYMVRMYGQPNEAADKDAWHIRFGMLVDFLSERFPPQDGPRS